jgi:hypothetical protein
MDLDVDKSRDPRKDRVAIPIADTVEPMARTIYDSAPLRSGYCEVQGLDPMQDSFNCLSSCAYPSARLARSDDLRSNDGHTII